jgi:hypothetical protein
VDEVGSSDGNPLEGDWARFLEVDVLKAGTQRDAKQHNVGLHNIG